VDAGPAVDQSAQADGAADVRVGSAKHAVRENADGRAGEGRDAVGDEDKVDGFEGGYLDDFSGERVDLQASLVTGKGQAV